MGESDSCARVLRRRIGGWKLLAVEPSEGFGMKRRDGEGVRSERDVFFIYIYIHIYILGGGGNMAVRREREGGSQESVSYRSISLASSLS